MNQNEQVSRLLIGKKRMKKLLMTILTLSLAVAVLTVSLTIFPAITMTQDDTLYDENNIGGIYAAPNVGATPDEASPDISVSRREIEMVSVGAYEDRSTTAASMQAETQMSPSYTDEFLKYGYNWTVGSDADTSDIETGYTLDAAEDGKVSVDKSVVYGEDDYAAFDSYYPYEFSVALSALAQEYNLYNRMEVDIPLDVVFILDTSGSMRQAADDNLTAYYGDVTKASAMTTALNTAVRYLMNDNAYNRVGVVTYSDGAADLLALDHYTTSNTSGDYFSYSETYTGNGNNRTVSGCTITTVSGGIRNASGTTVTASTASQNSNQVANWLGTYTQGGIARAAKMFERVNDTTITDASGNIVKRKPVFIMLSDGEPTYCNPDYTNVITSSGSYTDIYGCGSSSLLTFNNNTANQNQNNKGILGYYTILSANYYKNAVANHYNRTANFYTIGEGTGAEGIGTITTSISIAGDEYRRAILNPTGENITTLSTSNYTYAGITANQLYELLHNSFTDTTVTIQPGSYTHAANSGNYNNVINTSSTSYIVPVNPNTYSNYAYANNSYFGNLSSTELSAVFQAIVEESKETVEYGFALRSNTAVTFTDTLGDGMQVSEAPVLRYNGSNYAATSFNSHNDGTATTVTYVYDYTESNVVTSLTRTVELRNIIVTVTTDNATGRQTVFMAIPEACMPVIAHDNNDNWDIQMPVRLLFKVKPTAEAIRTAITARQEDPGADIRFYTNDWGGTAASVGANAVIHPSWNNPYYYDLNTYEDDAVQKGENTSGAYDYVKTSVTGYDDDTDPNYPAKLSVITIGNNGVVSIGSLKEQIDVAVNKVWRDSAGSEITDTSAMPNVTVHLKRRTDTGTDDSFDEERTLNRLTAFSTVFSGLDYMSDDDEIYYYYIEEDEIIGYTSASSGEVSWDSGSITLTNTEKPLEDGRITVQKLWRNLDGLPDEPPDDAQVDIRLMRRVASATDGKTITVGSVPYTVRVGSTLTFNVSASIRSSTSTSQSKTVTLYANGERVAYTTSSSRTVNVNLSGTYTTTVTADQDDYSVTLTATCVRSNGTTYTTTLSNTAATLTSYEVPTDVDSSAFDDETIEIVTLSDDTGWSHTFDALALTGADSTHTFTYVYYVIEDPGYDGYAVTYENNDGGISGTIRVINTAVELYPHYELPATGGTGTLIFYLFAIAAMLYSAVSLYRRRHKGGGSS